jgi:hypothetical protein
MKNFSQQKLISKNTPAVRVRTVARSAKRRSREVPICDEEKIDRLNVLAKCPPFCVWYKSRTNDPL